MAGGLLQLAAYGSENQYLNGNPQLTFFKMVYRRYTNFAMQSIEVQFEGMDNISYDKTTVLKTRIPRDADLISHMFFCFDLPDIYMDESALFRWIDRIGPYLINTVKVNIGSTTVEQLYGEYIDAYHELNMTADKQDTYNQMIANLPEYYHSSSLSTDSKTTTVNGRRCISPSYNCRPSIRGKRLYVPLPFWFHRHIGLAVPLIALQYHEVTVEMELKAIRDLYTVGRPEHVFLGEALSNQGGVATSMNLDTSFNRYRWSRPISPEDEIKSFTKLSLNQWNLNPSLEVNYIFLDNSERQALAAYDQKYLIEKVTKYELEAFVGQRNVEMELYHPVKEILILSRRDDIRDRNAWSNFTNLDTIDQVPWEGQTYFHKVAKTALPMNPLLPLGCFRTDGTNDAWLYDSAALNDPLHTAIQTIVDPSQPSLYATKDQCLTTEQIKTWLKQWEYRSIDQIPAVDRSNQDFFRDPIVERIEIKFNGNTRLDAKPADYFGLVQPYIHHTNSPRTGMLMYSFSIEPDKYQPSGACNFSHLKKVEFNMRLKNPKIYEDPSKRTVLYNTTLYIISYNVLQIMSGMAGLVFGN